MSDDDLNRMLKGVVDEFTHQNGGAVPKYAVLNFCEADDHFRLSREALDEQIELLIQRGDIVRTDEGVTLDA